MADAKKSASGGMHRYRTHTCGGLRKSDSGATVRLSDEGLRILREMVKAGPRSGPRGPASDGVVCYLSGE